jgi:hypothetical protein
MPHMTTLAHFAPGRMLLHVIAMVGDGSFGFHLSGIRREFAGLIRARPLTRPQTP